MGIAIFIGYTPQWALEVGIKRVHISICFLSGQEGGGGEEREIESMMSRLN